MKLLIMTQVVDHSHPVLGFFHEWIAELATQYEYIEVIALQVGEHALPENVTVHSLGKEKGVGRLGYLRTVVRLVRALTYDQVFVHMNVEYLMLFGWYWKLKRIPAFLWYVHRSVSLRLRFAHLFATHVFSTGPESFRMQSSKVLFVGHGIQTVPFEALQRETFSALSVGRISEAKRIHELCQVATVAEVPFTIIGAPATLKDEIYSVSVFEEYGDKVSFLGPMPHNELSAYYKKASIFLHMSDTGSTDKVVLEAMQYGVLPISTSIAFKDVLNPHGLFVSSGDISGMVAAIKRVREMDSTEQSYISKEFAVYVKDIHSLDTLIKRLRTIMGNYVE